MSAGSTESFYVPFEVSKILKKRGYQADYQGIDKAYYEDGLYVDTGKEEINLDSESIFPMAPWELAFRFLRERYGIYAYIKRDTYWKKWRYVFEHDKPRGESISAVYDTVDDARVGLFKRIDEEELPKMFENPDHYDYTYPISEEEKEEAKEFRKNIEDFYKKQREEILKNAEKPEL